MRSAALLVLAAVFAACGDGATPEPTQTFPPATATRGPPTETPTGLSEYDFASPLLVKGREWLRACVQILDKSVAGEDAVEAIEEALLRAIGDSRWPEKFGTPTVDLGCPLPPLALEDKEAVCRPEVGPYLVYAFVGDASLFAERFPEDRVRLLGGRRPAGQERIRNADGGSECAYHVAEAWFLTSKDLSDPHLLEEYIFNIGPIADICC